MACKLAWLRFLKVLFFGALAIVLTYIGNNVGIIVPDAYSWAIPGITALLTAILTALEKLRKETERERLSETEKIADDVLDKVIDNISKKK